MDDEIPDPLEPRGESKTDTASGPGPASPGAPAPGEDRFGKGTLRSNPEPEGISTPPTEIEPPVASPSGPKAGLTSSAAEPATPDDPKWYGVPPAGKRPIEDKTSYLLQILAVIAVEFVIWAIYRYLSAPYLGGFGTATFYLAHIIAAPTIHLGPILVWWYYIRKESGLPFRFGTKRLFTGVLVGLFGAVLWRFAEQLVTYGLYGLSGSLVKGSFGLFSELDYTSFGLFALMTFVQFCVVGPVEELEFRGFVQDQAMRASSKGFALAMSSVLFGCSHIPIALFVYKMTGFVFVVALLSWIMAGTALGALYMWSRSLWAVIVMHGMANWLLSVLYLSAALKPEAAGSGGVLLSDAFVAVAVNGGMIIVFYLVHRLYWGPRAEEDRRAISRGDLPAGGFVRVRDRGVAAGSTAAILAVVVLVVLGAFTGIASSLSDDPFSNTPWPSAGEEGVDLGEYTGVKEILRGEGELGAGDSIEIPLNATNATSGYLVSVTVTLTWTDEEDIVRFGRTYENQPDTFALAVEISGAGETLASEEGSGSNAHGQPGEVVVTVTLDDDATAALIANGTYPDGRVVVTLVDCGGFYPRFGVVGYADAGNAYAYEAELGYLVKK